MKDTQTIRDFYGRVLGYIETESNGDKTVRDFYHVILGYYNKRQDVTTDFYRRIIGRGDMSSALIYQAEAERENK